jgi:general secretion pathway protein M
VLEKLIQQWQGLSTRDRRVLGLGSAGLVLILGYFVLFEPAWLGRQQLEKDIPGLRSQLARLEGISAEARRLSGGGAASTGAESLAQARIVIEQSLEAAKIKETQIQVVGDMLEMRFKSMPMTVWLEWLNEALRQSRLRVVDAQLTRDAAGMTTARLALSRPSSDTKNSK